MATTIKAFGEVMMRLATPNHLMLHQTNTLNITYTGTGVNVLSGLSNFGYKTSLITRLPHNSIGSAALSHIRSLGISTEDISEGGQYLGMYFLENGFGVRPTKVTYSNRSESSFCTSSVKNYDLEKILLNTKVIHFCGITLAISERTRQMVLHIAREASQRGIIVVFDCNYRPKLWDNSYLEARKWYEQILPHVDICFMTERDAELILGLETNYTDQKEKRKELLSQVAKQYGIQYIAGTIRSTERNSDGKEMLQGFLMNQSQITYSQKYRFKILDRIGAGDGFASGLIFGYSRCFTNSEKIEFATASGVLAHTTYGDSPISTAEDVWSLINNENLEIDR